MHVKGAGTLLVRTDILIYLKYRFCTWLGSVTIRTIISPNPPKQTLGKSPSLLCMCLSEPPQGSTVGHWGGA